MERRCSQIRRGVVEWHSQAEVTEQCFVVVSHQNISLDVNERGKKLVDSRPDYPYHFNVPVTDRGRAAVKVRQTARNLFQLSNRVISEVNNAKEGARLSHQSQTDRFTGAPLTKIGFDVSVLAKRTDEFHDAHMGVVAKTDQLKNMTMLELVPDFQLASERLVEETLSTTRGSSQ